MNTVSAASRMLGHMAVGMAAVCAVTSCQPREGGTAAQEAMEHLAQQTVQMYETKNWDMINDLVASDYVRHDPHSPVPVESRDGLREYFAFLGAAYPDMRIAIDEVFVSGDKIVSRFTFSGTNTGARGDLPATGNRVEVTGATIARVVDGVFVEEWAFTDYLSTMQQLGFTLTPP